MRQSVSAMSNSHKFAAVFLDRDGVINRNRADYVKTWEEFQFLEGALYALCRLASSPFRIVVISNQSAIGRNLVKRQALEDIHRRMLSQITSAGGRVDQVFYCPHRADEGCDCRKPRPGLLLQASSGLGLDLSRSYFVGDSLDDVAAAYAAGCTPVLVRTGRGMAAVASLDESGTKRPVVVNDLSAAVSWILEAGHESAEHLPSGASDR